MLAPTAPFYNNKSSRVTELQALGALKKAQWVLVHGHTGLVMDELSLPTAQVVLCVCELRICAQPLCLRQESSAIRSKRGRAGAPSRRTHPDPDEDCPWLDMVQQALHPG